MAVVHHNTHCRAKTSGNAIQVRVTTEEMSGERYMGCTGEMGGWAFRWYFVLVPGFLFADIWRCAGLVAPRLGD